MIAVAYGETLQEMTYLGLMGLMDPPRNGVKEAVQCLNESGVSVKMLTGDARETAVAIGNFKTFYLYLFNIFFPLIMPFIFRHSISSFYHGVTFD